jgi:hypothetical protein
MGNENVNPEAEKESVSEKKYKNSFSSLTDYKPPTEMKNRSLSWGIKVPVHRADNLATFMW